MKKLTTAALFLAAGFILVVGGCETTGSASRQEAVSTPGQNSLFAGDGGKGITLAVLVPTPSRPLTNDVDDYLPTLVQSSLTSGFNRVSAITVVDRQNQDKILANQTLSANGNYSDEDFISIGNLTNAQLILAGSITNTSAGYVLDLGIADASKGERKYSMAPKPFSAAQILSGEAAATAVEELLSQMKIPLTAQGKTELYKTAKQDTVNAEVAISRGIVAQKKGTEVQALQYYFQAANYDSTLTEAASRVNILSANITSGNMGENVRNDIAWHDQWTARLAEAEKVYTDNMKGPTPYYLVYDFNIKQGDVNYSNRTVTVEGVTVDLVPVAAWFNASVSVVQVINVVRNGLLATGQAEKWGLNWPRDSIGRNYPFNGRGDSFTVVVELVNQDGKTIGSERIGVSGGWDMRWKDNSRALWGITPRIQGSRTLSFQRVSADLITDRLTIRIASIDGVNAETAAKTKAINILREAEYAQLPEVKAGTDSRSILRAMHDFDGIADGVIEKYRGTDKNIVIPALVFGIPVTAIGPLAFTEKRRVNRDGGTFDEYVSKGITSLIIPNSITSIGEAAFTENDLTSLTIPKSVTVIGMNAFVGNPITSITIPENVHLSYAVGNNFDTFYNKKNGKKAGTYTTTAKLVAAPPVYGAALPFIGLLSGSRINAFAKWTWRP